MLTANSQRVTLKKTSMNYKVLCFAAIAACSSVAYAFPIADPGTEGLKVFVAGTNEIIATYQGNSAAFSNDLYLDGFGFVFNNHANAVGDAVNLGTYAVGTELKFRLHVNNTGYDYFTGPGALNPDSHTHARVQSNWAPGTTLVSFEDLFNGPFDYNDLSFSFTNTRGGDGSSVPDSTSSLLALTLAMGGLVSFKKFLHR